jgi:hypothetical protein
VILVEQKVDVPADRIVINRTRKQKGAIRSRPLGHRRR